MAELPAFYLMIQAADDGIGVFADHYIERACVRSWETLVKDIWGGQPFCPVINVLRVDPVNKTCEDVTNKLARDLSNRSHDLRETPLDEVCDLIDANGHDWFIEEAA